MLHAGKAIVVNYSHSETSTLCVCLLILETEWSLIRVLMRPVETQIKFEKKVALDLRTLQIVKVWNAPGKMGEIL